MDPIWQEKAAVPISEADLGPDEISPFIGQFNKGAYLYKVLFMLRIRDNLASSQCAIS